jgi:hypothetical protein
MTEKEKIMLAISKNSKKYKVVLIDKSKNIFNNLLNV